jgi:hypothetical protein
MSTIDDVIISREEAGGWVGVLVEEVELSTSSDLAGAGGFKVSFGRLLGLERHHQTNLLAKPGTHLALTFTVYGYSVLCIVLLCW